MGYLTIAEHEEQVNLLLRQAMSQERCKQWSKVIQSYKSLLQLMRRECLPLTFEPLPWYRMLMYESYQHLAVAFQQLGKYDKAVENFTKALEAVFIAKNGCTAGCSASTVLMTPIYARRALAHCLNGDLKAGLKDAEKSVVLDNKNSAVYCVRALVRSTRSEEMQALEDAKTALKFNPSDQCALILKGALSSNNIQKSGPNMHPDHKKACDLAPHAVSYLNVDTVRHPAILEFYDRFLYSLVVPHTVSRVPLLKSCNVNPSAGRQTLSRLDTTSVLSARMSSAHLTSGRRSGLSQSSGSGFDLSSKTEDINLDLDTTNKPFRCGTPADQTKRLQVFLRQRIYGRAVREFNNRPKTDKEYLALLEKQTMQRLMENFERNRTPVIDNRQPSPFHTRCTPDPQHAPRAKSAKSAVSSTSRAPSIIKSVLSDSNSAFSRNIKAFEVKLGNSAPRMYYRPWLGDKLPPADVDRKTWTVPFKV